MDVTSKRLITYWMKENRKSGWSKIFRPNTRKYRHIEWLVALHIDISIFVYVFEFTLKYTTSKCLSINTKHIFFLSLGLVRLFIPYIHFNILTILVQSRFEYFKCVRYEFSWLRYNSDVTYMILISLYIQLHWLYILP